MGPPGKGFVLRRDGTEGGGYKTKKKEEPAPEK